MSSTNRSSERLKHVSDYYVTPVNKILSFLKEFEKQEHDIKSFKILDPCAGGDTNHLMSYPEALIKFGVEGSNITTMDLREDSLAGIKKNYLETDVKNEKYNMIITNPPFICVMEIIEKALDDVIDYGYVIMLLRLNYFGSKKRKHFWENNMPKFTYVHSARPSFTDDGKTDSIEYMHCVWQKNYNTEFTQLKVID